MAKRYAPNEIQTQPREEGKSQQPDTLGTESMEQSIRARQTEKLELSPELNAWFSKRLDGRPTL